MSLYEPVFRHVLFPAYESGLRRRNTLRYLHEYEHNQWLPHDEIDALQWRKLKQLVEHCWNEVPYYRQRWKQLGLADAGDIRGPADYARLPVLTKQDIRDNFEQLIAPSYRAGLLYKTTGGSTGEPLRFGYTRESYERRIATMFRGYGWAGARLGQRTLYLWGASLTPARLPGLKDSLYHAAFNRRMLNAFQMSEGRMAEYADAIDAYKPDVIVSYVAPILKMAEWMLANGRRLKAPQRIMTAAEALHEPQRRIIEQAFGCPAYNTYGCREVMLIAAECEHRNGLHLNADHLKVELGARIDPSSDAAPSELLITDLHNYGMPLLRYANGDLGTAASGACACGRGLPRLASVDGRKLDALRTVDGHFIPGEFIVYIFLAASGIKRYQVVQRRLDALDITLVRDADFDESVLDLLRGELRKAVGTSIDCNFVYADDIPLTPTGKFRVTISELA
ncbi:MAG: phenylacetate--CoA ligase family protein [Lysobacter sp.]|nr:phenylacetate--CoA ligase family protein [Lysobacter sp.]